MGVDQDKYHRLRADIWRIAADKELSETELIQKLLDKLGPAVDVDRVSFLRFDPAKKGFVGELSWKKPGVQSTIEAVIPSYLAKHYLGRSFVELPKDTLPVTKPIAIPLLVRYGIKSYLAVPFGTENTKPEGIFAFSDCTTRRDWSELEKNLLFEVVQIVSSRVEQLKVEKALLQSETRYRTLVEGSADGIFVHNEQKVLFFNGRVNELLGYEGSELLGLDFQLLFHPESRRQVCAHAQTCLRAENGITQSEVKLLRKDGSWFHGGVHARIILFEGEECLQVRFRDISNRKQLEIEKEGLQELLLQSQKMEAMGRLAGGVAHDFNNLLTVISGYVEFMQSTIDDDSPIIEDMKEVRQATARAIDLTAQLLTFSRKEALDSQVIQPNEVLRASHRMLQRLIGEDVDFAFRPSEELWCIRLSPGQLDQVLMNLAVNGRDAMNSGGALTVETANIPSQSASDTWGNGKEPGDYVMISVSDTGLGMDEETQKRIFEPFFSTKAKDKGTGLGLSTVYAIVRQNEGHIDVFSEPEVGSTFRIYFPAVIEEDVSPPHSTVAVQGGGTETILLVEDEELVRRLATRILEKNGYSVIEMASGGRAIQYLEENGHAFDLLLTDVVMPGISGRDLYDRLRKDRPGMKVLFMSGYSEGVIRNRGVLETGTEFLQKPFNIKSLTTGIRRVLDS